MSDENTIDDKAMNFQIPSPVQLLVQPCWSKCRALAVKRDDLIHPIVSGNKARKLQNVFRRCLLNQPKKIITMGGNRSNFLHALSYWCFRNNIQLIAKIRGPEPKRYFETLADLVQWGTILEFVSRDEFKLLRQSPPLVDNASTIWIPEGGSDRGAVEAVKQSVEEVEEEPDWIFVPVGTGCTALGIALGLKEKGWRTKVVGVVVLKGAETLIHSIEQLAQDSGYNLPNNLYFEHRFCGKGFGKQTEALSLKQIEYQDVLNIPLEPVYSVKMLDAFKAYCEENRISATDRVLLWHTGGLQGN